MSNRDKKVYLGFAIIVLSCIFYHPAFSKPVYPKAVKNVILMISDGAGFNTFEAGNYYQFGEKMPEVYRDFTIKIASKTDMLNFIDKKLLRLYLWVSRDNNLSHYCIVIYKLTTDG